MYRKAMRARIKNIEFQNNLAAAHDRNMMRNEVLRLEGMLSRVAPGLREHLVETRDGLKARYKL